MAYAIPSSSISMTAATSAPWLTEHPHWNLTNIPIDTSCNISSPTSTFNYTPTPQPTNLTCSPQPPSYGPLPPVENTPYTFSTWPQIRQPALSALTPERYTLSFRDANASYVGVTYLGHYELRSYDAGECARRCDGWGDDVNGNNIEAMDGRIRSSGLPTPPPTPTPSPQPSPSPHPQICNGFNIYFERSPSIHLGSNCRDAASRTITKCALWGEGVEEKGATNTGSREWDFNVEIAGSNGYRLGEEDVKSIAWRTRSGGLMAISVAVMIGGLVVGGMGF